MRERDDLQGKLTTTETTLQQAAEFGSQLVAQVNQQRFNPHSLHTLSPFLFFFKKKKRKIYLVSVKDVTLKDDLTKIFHTNAC